MSVDFAEPRLLTLAGLLTPLAAWFLWWAARRRRDALDLLVRGRLRADLVLGVSPARRAVKHALLVAALGLLLLSLARPRWGVGDEIARARGRDIVVCVDVSRSMMATDVAPSRLARAKLACYDLLALTKSDRLGLVAFAGQAFLQCPLALDGEAFRQNVAALDTDSVPEQGTSLGGALDEALGAFPADSAAEKVVVLVTDGEDHEAQALSAARRLARADIRLFTVGVGTPNGELLKSADPYGNPVFFKDEDGNPVRSRLDEELLARIAEAARGFYTPLQGSRTMASIYERGIAPLARTAFAATTIRTRTERFQWPLGIGLLLLVVELLLPEGATRKAAAPRRAVAPPSGGVPATAALTAAALLCLCEAPALLASPDAALEDYAKGDFPGARAEYERLARENPDDLRLRFNAGAAAYREGDFKAAAGLFEQVLRSPDLGLQQQGWYNLGNARYRAGEAEEDPARKREEWQQALASFSAASKLDPADADARNNHAFVRHQIESIPPPPEQSPGDDGDSKDRPDESKPQQKPQQRQRQKQQEEQQQRQSEPDSGDKKDHAEQQRQQGQEKDSGEQQGGKSQGDERGGQAGGEPKDAGKQQDAESRRQAAAGRDEKDPRGDESKPAAGSPVQVGKDGEDTREGGAAEDGSGKDERKGLLMTVREAEKVLDAQKGSEKALMLRSRTAGENAEGGARRDRRRQW